MAAGQIGQSNSSRNSFEDLSSHISIGKISYLAMLINENRNTNVNGKMVTYPFAEMSLIIVSKFWRNFPWLNISHSHLTFPYVVMQNKSRNTRVSFSNYILSKFPKVLHNLPIKFQEIKFVVHFRAHSYRFLFLPNVVTDSVSGTKILFRIF